MDTTAEDIHFDEEGVCNYCTNYIAMIFNAKLASKAKQERINKFISEVKNTSSRSMYDCVVGVSGGVDSSYALYLAVKNGLKPLAVHLDNGWNSEIAVNNIENLVKKLGVDLYTHVIDWQENRSLQVAFFRANVVDIELLMDNAMLALNYKMAAKHKVKYILAGTNMATEGMPLPPGWNHYKKDARNIKSINKKFGSCKIKSHPIISTLGYMYYEFVRGIRWISFLDYFDFVKDDAVAILVKELDYKPYPYKHYESVFTRFYQGYILPNKFGFDKRRVHLSTLVASGEMKREDALKHFDHPPYMEATSQASDMAYVCKKLGFTEDQFAAYILEPSAPHSSYGSEKWLWDLILKARSKLNYRRKVRA